jgi:glycosyltransferase involved in cell wall biosynthesis
MCTIAVEPGSVGGAERQAMLQARELVARGDIVTIVAPRANGPRREVRHGVRVVRLPRLPFRGLRTISYLPVLFCYLLAIGRRTDLVHVHLAGPQADVAALACRIIRRPLYVKIASGGPLGEVQLMARFALITRRIGLRWAGAVQALSDQSADDLRAVGIPDERIVRLPNGFDASSLTPPTADDRVALRAELGLPRDAVIVLFLGRFVRYKGVLDLLDAWLLRPPGEPRLVLVGEPRLDDPAGELPTRSDVIVHGWTEDAARYLRAIEVLVMPSHTEGMSNTILEAMAAGRAIVATEVGAAREMLGDGGGVLVPPHDPPALRAALDLVLGDADLREALGRRARAVVEERFSIKAVVDGLETVYDALLRPG